jgi:hypothetical protein
MITHRNDAHAGDYEFSAEQDRVVSQLANSLRWTSAPMVCLGFLVLIDLLMYAIWLYRQPHGWDNLQLVALPLFLLGIALLFIFMGSWTGRAATAFRRIVETRGSDIRHLMDGLTGLDQVFGIIAGFVKAMVLLTFLALVLNLIWVYTARNEPVRPGSAVATATERY